MAQHEIETQWMGKMQFNALVNGHTVVMDAPERSGGEDLGPIPKPFILTALAGCTGMDIVALLRNEHKEVAEFSMKVTGELSRQKPIEYIAIHISYQFRGDSTCREEAMCAVTASQEYYCGVSHMLKKALPVTWDVIFNGEQIFNNRPAEEILASNVVIH
ncbi:MAG: OsmC family protein [Bacteroidota bacterium]